MLDNLYCIIMAGGLGNRLWPLSQQSTPKQFLDLIGIGQTMLQLTFNRFRSICEPDHFVVVTNEHYRDMVREQLPELPESNILLEPFRRNTAACIAYASTFIKQRCPEAITVVTPSDHFIVNEALFVESIKRCAVFAQEQDALITIGIRVHKPETAFGYIQVGDPVFPDQASLCNVKTFTEKPNAEMAQIFYECGDFCWNSGVFVWSLKAIDSALEKFMPNIKNQFAALDSMPVSHWNRESIVRVYEECENVSIDYGVMEKARNVYVELTDAMWSDLGSWESIFELGRKDSHNNAVMVGKAILHKSKNCLIHVPSSRFCIIEGLSNFMVVERNGVILICPRDSGNATWKYAAEMKAEVNN